MRNAVYIWYTIVILFFAGLLYAPFLQSISLILWMFFGIYHVGKGRSKWMAHFEQFFQSGPWLWVTIFFLIALLGGLYTDHYEPWLDRMRIKLPFLLIPFFVFAQKRLSQEVLLNTYGLFIVLLSISSLFILVNIFLDFSAYVENLSSGIPVDTGIQHARYSMLVAIACLACFYWSEKLNVAQQRIAKGIGIYLFFFLHMLAVRSGLMAFYGCILFWAIFHITQYRTLARWTWVLLFPLLAFFLLPGFKARFVFMWKDISKKERTEQSIDFSDRDRLLSWKVGYQIFRSAPLFGIGTGDLRPMVKNIYGESFLRSDFLMPHNQWLSILAAHGIVGFLIFNMVLWKLWQFFWRQRDHLAISCCLVYGLSMLVENSMETAAGVAIFIFFIPLHLLSASSSAQVYE